MATYLRYVHVSLSAQTMHRQLGKSLLALTASLNLVALPGSTLQQQQRVELLAASSTIAIGMITNLIAQTYTVAQSDPCGSDISVTFQDPYVLCQGLNRQIRLEDYMCQTTCVGEEDKLFNANHILRRHTRNGSPCD
ncbi:hypothetical protein EJ03DRAFT_159816 [Teratosphaeria nubilosa]|uniref:Uncharacterized protein n=1 Tax=Teratosphaeria nubilosa TaxID=161662 RepID=A0A6G1L2S6_9PEZI|nr:hypothetical protein EJ03DRAFT_159816 [Teratosphaeria nubilosa]